MAKYRRYRKYTRARRARWSSNLLEIGTTTIQAPQNSTFYNDFTLAFNPLQTNTATSQTYTVKNLEVTFEVSTSGVVLSYLEDITAYIMFKPQGMNVTSSYNLEHPEYIMAYKFLGSPTADAPQSMAQPIKVRTRLARTLNTGDSIILFIKGNNTASGTGMDGSLEVHGLVRWWTKAN